MTDATALREPFDHVQRVTKKWKDKQTGQQKSITLDYIGHAVVTDRLLKVDPTYSFEPLVDASGFPIVVTAGLAGGDEIGVWGRLTILDSSVVEFCSGKDLMDAYSRCLCRAAMRRGVALDLWIKDNEFKANGKESGAGPTESNDSGRENPDRSGTISGSADNPAPEIPDALANPAINMEIAALVAQAAKLRKTTQKAVWEALSNDGYTRNQLSPAQAEEVVGKLKRWIATLAKS